MIDPAMTALAWLTGCAFLLWLCLRRLDAALEERLAKLPDARGPIRASTPTRHAARLSALVRSDQLPAAATIHEPPMFGRTNSARTAFDPEAAASFSCDTSPATCLPMLDAVDVAGNSFGLDFDPTKFGMADSGTFGAPLNFDAGPLPSTQFE